ncbi:MAG: glycosyltransferase family 2 protein [Lentisphaerae bacterium]|nr:glycosyltransferase family 2 protein [Lentisphaerota bacterium]
MPLVTVFIPVYNRQQYIAQAIESILSQSFRDFELIIINDGSTDNTEEVILSFKSPKIRYYRNDQNLGIPATRNKGLNLAKGKYMALLDSDDIALPNRLEVQVSYMEANPDVVVSGTFFKKFNMFNGYIHHIYQSDEEIKSYFLWGIPILQPTIIIRLGKINSTGMKYSEEFNVAEDYDFFARVANEINGKITNLKCKLTFYRRHPGNITSSRSAEERLKSVRKIRKSILKPLFGNAYMCKYPYLIEIMANRNFSCHKELADCFDFLFLLKAANQKKQLFSVSHFNQHIKNMMISLIVHFIVMDIKKSIGFNFNFQLNKKILVLIYRAISEEKTLMKKIKFILLFNNKFIYLILKQFFLRLNNIMHIPCIFARLRPSVTRKF